MRRRRTLHLAAGLGTAQALPATGRSRPGADGPRLLRYAFPVAESGFDPPRITDVYSRTVISHIFEAPYAYDHLARPARIVAPTAARSCCTLRPSPTRPATS